MDPGWLLRHCGDWTGHRDRLCCSCHHAVHAIKKSRNSRSRTDGDCAGSIGANDRRDDQPAVRSEDRTDGASPRPRTVLRVRFPADSSHPDGRHPARQDCPGTGRCRQPAKCSVRFQSAGRGAASGTARCATERRTASGRIQADPWWFGCGHVGGSVTRVGSARTGVLKSFAATGTTPRSLGRTPSRPELIDAPHYILEVEL
jgi:hypothetical protein